MPRDCEACNLWACVYFVKNGATHWLCLRCWKFSRLAMMEAP